MKTAIITISTSVAAGETEDRSGAALAELARGRRCRDRRARRRRRRPHGDRGRAARARRAGASLIFTTGGTGFTHDDVTPEATLRGDRPRGARVRRGDAGRGAQAHADGDPDPWRVGDRRTDADHQLPRQPEGDRRAVPGHRADARARRRDAAARGWTQNAPAIELRGLVRHFGERTALREVSRAGAGGRDARRARAQRRRQVDAAADPCDAAAPARRRRARVRRAAAAARLRGPRAARAAGARAAAVPRSERAREPRATTRGCTGSSASASRSCSTRSGCERRADDPVRLLSRGMVQRLAIVPRGPAPPRSCCCSTSRAPTSTRRASELVEPLIGRASGRTRVLTSHDPQAALAEADLVLALKDGRAAFVGEPGELDAAAAEGAVRVRTALAVLRKDLLLELRDARDACRRWCCSRSSRS